MVKAQPKLRVDLGQEEVHGSNLGGDESDNEATLDFDDEGEDGGEDKGGDGDEDEDEDENEDEDKDRGGDGDGKDAMTMVRMPVKGLVLPMPALWTPTALL